MEKKVIPINITTPMFSSGKDNKKAELRASEVKALMRNTFRAASHIADTSELYKAEAELFGDAEEHTSPIRIQLIEKSLNKPYKPLLLHRSSPPKAQCLAEGGSFDIVLRKFLKKGQSLSFYYHLLVLSSILGGLGKRSRRGRGGFALVDLAELAPHLTKDSILGWVTEQLNLLNEQTTNLECQPYMLNQGKIVVHPGAKSEWSKHNRPIIEEVRLGRPIINVSVFLKRVDNASHEIKKEYSHTHKYIYATGYAGRGRLASSLLISVTRTSDNQLLPIYTFVKAVVDPQKHREPLDVNHEERNKMIALIEEGGL